MSGCETAPPVIEAEVTVAERREVPERFRTVPAKPEPPALKDGPMAEWMTHMDAVYEALVAQYRALYDWADDGDPE